MFERPASYQLPARRIHDLKSEGRPHVFIMPEMGLAYFKQFQSAFEAAGWRVTLGSRLPSHGVLFNRPISVVHLHMVDMLFLQGSRHRALLRFLWFIAVVIPVYRWRGGRFIWTCHEIEPHEGGRQNLAHWMARRVSRCADAIIVHNHRMAERVNVLVAKWATAPVIHVVPHGSLEPYYARTASVLPHPRPGLGAAAVTFVAVGFMRPNKGTDIILAAFRRLAAPHARLIVAGSCNDDDYYKRLTAIAPEDPRIEIRRGNLTDGELIALHARADAAVFAFRECATSGSLISAMSLGCCIIAPKIGHAIELIGPQSGMLYDPDDDGTALREKMEYALTHPEDIHARGEHARESVRHPAWDEIVRTTEQIYLSPADPHPV